MTLHGESGHKRARVGPVRGVSEGSVSVGTFLLTVAGLYTVIIASALIFHKFVNEYWCISFEYKLVQFEYFGSIIWSGFVSDHL